MCLILFGIGDVCQVLVYGCDCLVCCNVCVDVGLCCCFCSVLLECVGQCWLIDSGLVDFCECFLFYSFDGIFQIYYYVDYVQGLLYLCWGQGLVILVYGLVDLEGFVDFYKYLGIFDFSQFFGVFEWCQWGVLVVIVLLLVYLKLIFGYLLEGVFEEGMIWCLVYFIDIVGLLVDSVL